MDEIQPVEPAAPTPAPELEATAATPDSESSTPEAAEKPKVFSQEEVDALISKRLAREQRKWERTQKQAALPEAPKELPPADSFESTEAYADALAEQKARELVARREAERQQAELLEAYHDREEEARTKYEDFEQVAYNQNLPITTVMAQTIQASDVGPDVAYYLGSNPREADRISRLSPYLQAKEIGKIEAKLVDNPPVKKSTNAPPPIKPVTAKGSSGGGYETTDPRSISSMSTSEWIEAERRRQIKQWEAQHRR
ncbi:MAG: hypothetical protein EBR49_13660 [Betaproteobacteria bacterium]|nr:hypothetical protein [Betaproteobacteria bacterium]